MLPVTLIKLRSYVEQIVIIYICVCLLSHVKAADVPDQVWWYTPYDAWTLKQQQQPSDLCEMHEQIRLECRLFL